MRKKKKLLKFFIKFSRVTNRRLARINLKENLRFPPHHHFPAQNQKRDHFTMPGSNASPGLAAGTPAPAATAKKKAPRGASWQISEGIIALYSAIHANQLSKVDLIKYDEIFASFPPQRQIRPHSRDYMGNRTAE
jgi:hypothetical protein